MQFIEVSSDYELQTLNKQGFLNATASPRSASDSRARVPRFDTRSGHLLLFSSSADSIRAVASYWRK